jgi:hypothetical protein
VNEASAPPAFGRRERLAKLVVLSAAALVALHLVVWIVEGLRSHVGLGGVLGRWDAEYYDEIVAHGYSGRLYAFFPLFPLVAGALARVTGTTGAAHWMGALVSLGCFAGFVAVAAQALRAGESWRGVLPETSTGWLFFLLTPSTYVFHYHGTEAMFLLWSFLAVLAVYRDNWLLGALFAGLSALTRTQGIFVAIAIALEAALRAATWPERVKRLVVCGAISGLLFILYPVWLDKTTGDPLAFSHAHTYWRQVDSMYGALATMWFGNPWQDRGVFSILHHVFFFVLMGGAVALAVWKPRSIPLAFYVAASAAVVTFQGELANMFRFGAVVFPALFVVGDKLDRWPRWARGAVLAGMLAFNLLWTWKYAAGKWAG